MKIINELKELKIKGDVICEVKKEKIPLVLWGCGEFAGEVLSYLVVNDVRIEDVFVDNKYYRKDLYLKGRAVLSESELQEKYSCVNVFLGCSNYEKREEIQSRQYVNKVFYLFSVNYGIFTPTPLSYIEENEHNFQRSFELLEDKVSKENFIAFLKTRITGDNCFIESAFKQECNFFHNDIFKIGSEEVYIDVGAYDGDTIKLFLNECKGRYKYIYALEPDQHNCSRLKQYIEDSNLNDVEVSDMGALDYEGKIQFSSLNEQISSVVISDREKESNVDINVNRLDQIFDYQYKVTIIKINYLEGVEEALKGAYNLLRSHHPKLAITVGFNCENIYRIPQIIKRVNNNYRVYLRFNRAMTSALTLYGICTE